tara:strand:- start:1836 stop:2582 length:747 start_codon:yes stop_codon:yes gene_type:complete
VIRPDSGAAKILGKDSRSLKYDDYNNIGYVSENQVIPDKLTIAQYLRYLQRLYKSWDHGFANSLTKQLELPLDREINKLSHGMRMKTVLIAGLAFRPKVLLLDEPLTGMDTLTRDEVVDGLLQQADETTIVISSHELSEIEYFTTHIAFMDKGTLYFQESIESLKSRFREVRVKLSAEKDISHGLPESWLFPEITGHLLRFLESDYQGQEDLNKKLLRRFGAVTFETQPMNLREISKSLIKSKRNSLQ